ncbi:Hypothetical predicted protein [Mytilus galloprovincialis]|uniref:CCHC-type domain-containing protein n=1 Tax=Mytilus galloprovincialis TaxID=29158 RepID=A0A8B6HRK6_MYTGA|nr:Hypothetical predicted protein [Mytilus galloprovincialis]
MEQYGPKKKRHRRRRRQRPYWDNDFDNQANQNYSPTATPIPRDPIVCYRCGGLDHIAIGCRIRLDHSRQAYTFQQINAEDRTYAYQQQQSTQDGKIDKNTTTTRKLDQPSYKPATESLVKILAFDGKHKLADKWEEDPYQIVNQPNKEIPVYEVKKENGTGRKKTLHRNLLLPIGFLPKTVESEIAPAPRQRRKPHRSGRPPTKSVGNSIEKMTASESDEESEQGIG